MAVRRAKSAESAVEKSGRRVDDASQLVVFAMATESGEAAEIHTNNDIDPNNLEFQSKLS